MTPARWYRIDHGEQVGPVDLVHMRTLVRDDVLGPDGWVWADGMPEWRKVRDVPALVPPADVVESMTSSRW